MSKYVPKEQLWTEFGGDVDFEYDHSVYWPALKQLSEERRAERTQRWEKGGKRIGEFEDYLSGKNEQSVNPPQSGDADKTEVEGRGSMGPLDADAVSERLKEVKLEGTAPSAVIGEAR